MDVPRWHLRFKNFCSTLALVEEAVARMERSDYSDLEKAGTVQRFEICWELAWKSMRDYLNDAGNPVEVPSAINVIRTAFQVNLIADGDGWVQAMKARNKMTHEYDIEAFEATVFDVRDTYLPMLLALRTRLEAERVAGN
jgi:nucleotidyltransferase substrate binding protein (TIGR01987 family)